MTSAALWLLLGAAICRVVEVRAPRFQRLAAAGIALASFAAWLIDRTTASELWQTTPNSWHADRITWFFQSLIFCWLGGHLLLMDGVPNETSAGNESRSRWLMACGAALLMVAGGEWIRFTIAADLLALTLAADFFRAEIDHSGEQSLVERSARWWMWPLGLSSLQWLGILLVAAETGSSMPEVIGAFDLVMGGRNSVLFVVGELLLLIVLFGRMLASPVVWRIPDRIALPEFGRLMRNVGLPVVAVLPFGLRFCANVPAGTGVELVCVCLILGLAAAAWAVFNVLGEESPVRSWLALFTVNTAWLLLGWAVLLFSAGEARWSSGGMDQILRVISTAAGMQLVAMLFASLGWLALMRHLLRDQRDRWLWSDWVGLVKASPFAGSVYCGLWANLLACPLSPGGWGRLGLLVPALLTILPGKGNELVGQPVFRIAACGFVLIDIIAWMTATQWLRQLVLDEPLNTQLNRKWSLWGALAIGCGVALLTAGLFPHLFIQHGPIPFRAGE